MSRQDDINQLISVHFRRLQKLKERQALKGISTEPETILEIEDIEAEIAKLQAELASKENYDLKAIRRLLTDALSADELRRLVYDTPDFRRVYNAISSSMGKDEIIDRLIDYSERQLLMNQLLAAVRELNPAQYFRYRDDLTLKEPTKEKTLEQRITQSQLSEEYTKALENPYVVGNPIQPDNLRVFLGRYDVAKSIINEIKKEGQKPSILLYGRRRMGKTSALLNIGYLIRDPNFLPIYISAQSVKFHTNVDFCYYLVQAITDRLLQDSIDTSIFQQRNLLTKNVFTQNPVLTLSEFFEECQKLLTLRNKHCLILIDEYEEIDQHINLKQGNYHKQNITKELMLELRDTLQHKPRFVFIFAGSHFLRELSKINWSEIFINVKTLPISFLQRDDGYKLLTNPVPDMRYQSQDLIERILDITGCQPFLLQAVASELVNTLNSKDTKTVTKEILDEAINGVLGKHNTYFDYIWDTECTNLKHQKLLKTISANPSGISEDKLTDYQEELRNLIRREVLKNENGIVKLTMPIVKLWMKKNQHIL
jgi:uncharacterized protein